MRKCTLLFFVMLFIASFGKASAVTVNDGGNSKSGIMPASDVTYCIPTGNDNIRKSAAGVSRAKERRLNTITVTGATFKGEAAPFSNTLDNAAGQTEVYQNLTDLMIKATKGDQIKFSWTTREEISWMHYYIYVDYDRDGVFNETNELVSYTYKYTPSEADATDSEGKPAKAGQSWSSAPKFTIPTDLPDGVTRLRLKIDWNHYNPCGNPETKNKIGANAGTILDYTIIIGAAPSYVINITQPAEGALIVTDTKGNVINNADEVEDGTELTIAASDGTDGMHLKHILINGSPIEGNKFIVKGATTISAVYTKDWKVNFVAPTVAGGTMKVTVAGADVVSGNWYAPGSELKVGFTLEEGYEVRSLLINKEEKKDMIVNNVFTTPLSSTVNIESVIAKISHTVKFISESSHGKIVVKQNNVAIESGAYVEHGKDVIIELIPNDDATLDKFTINGEDKFAEVKDVLMMSMSVKTNLDIVANFIVPTYTVTYNIMGKGTVDIIELNEDDEPTGVKYNSGDPIDQNVKLNLVFTPDQDYTLSKVTESIGGEAPTEIAVEDLINNTYELGWIASNYVYNVTYTTDKPIEYGTPTFSKGREVGHITSATTTGAIVNLNYKDTPASGSYDNYNKVVDESTIVKEGQVIELSVNAINGRWGVERIFVDLNADSVFSANEMVTKYGDTSNGNNNLDNVTASFTIPENIPLGKTRMRILFTDGDTKNDDNACGNYVDGGFYDFVFTVVDASYTFNLTNTTPEYGTAIAAYDNGAAVGSEAPKGSHVVITLTPKAGEEISSLKYNDTPVDLESETTNMGSYTEYAIEIKENATVEVAFTKKGDVGIEEASKDQTAYYDFKSQTLNIAENATAVIYDLVGNIVLTTNESITNLSTLNQGCYLIRVESATNKVENIKILKK